LIRHISILVSVKDDSVDMLELPLILIRIPRASYHHNARNKPQHKLVFALDESINTIVNLSHESSQVGMSKVKIILEKACRNNLNVLSSFS